MSVINTNLKSLISQDSLSINNRNLSTAMERLSTGNRINSAKDDAAGLAISTRMQSQINGLNMAVKNAYDTVSLTETAEGAMEEVTVMLQRMRELALQAANDTNSAKDRRYIQDEVDQLAAEIDRIAGTTQFNSINVLDGSYASKIFQIGSNNNQTMNISIGSMNSSVLGVATSNSASDSVSGATTGTTSTESTIGAAAEGTPPTKTSVNLEFLNSSGTDNYSFTIVDDISGLTSQVTDLTVDMTNNLSKDAFVAALNLSGQTAQTDTIASGSTNFSADIAASLDLTNAENYGKVKFAISIDGGATVQVDLKDRLFSNAAVINSAVTVAQVITAMDNELERLFDSRVGASANLAGTLNVEDQEGRRIKVSQGAGDGSLFGTDAANNGGILARETTRNNLTAEWEGNTLKVTNEAGGKVALSGFSAGASSAVVFNVVDDNQTDGVNEPVLLATATLNMNTQATSTYTGNVEKSNIELVFSDQTGNSAASAMYSFSITNGDGDVYANFEASALNVHSVVDQNKVRDDVLAQLSAGMVTLAGTDSSFNVNEFDVTFNGNRLSITNNAGRAIAVENYSSSAGFMTVTPGNEPGAGTVLADKNAYYSEMRVKLNTGAFGQDLSAVNTNRFLFSVDGVTNSADLVISTQGSAGLTSAGLISGAAFAASAKEAISAAVITIVDPNAQGLHGGSIVANADVGSITVTYDADTAELVFRDDAGRALGFGYDASANNLAGLNVGPLLDQFVSGPANKNFEINRDSAVAQGDVLNATETTITISDDDAAFNFQVNGQYLDGASTNASAAMSVAVTYNVADGFENSELKGKLDSLMTTLNAVHGSNVFEYSVDGRDITLYQRDGGEIAVGGFVTANTHKDLTASMSPGRADQGETVELKFQNHDKQLFATADGTGAVPTTATLNIEGDDLFALKISDGTQTYSLASTVVDISNGRSTDKFVEALEESLLGSAIKTTMDTDGNVFFKRDDGGQIILQEFTSSTGKTGTWSPGAGMGNSIALDGSGAVEGYTTTTSGTSSSSSVSGGGNTAVSSIDVTTSSGAQTALSAIDSALDYVQAERSNLGAIQNRLTHTIDNLTNIVTSTSASQSRIRDTDYAKTTSELARTQIISQAATAMLAQANQQPQLVLQLLQ
ncbi:MAG: flagellin [Burkholderiaceae bacterium]